MQKYYSKLSNERDIEKLTSEIQKESSSQTSYAQYVNWIKNQYSNTISEYWQNLLDNFAATHIFGKEHKQPINSDDIITIETPLNEALTQQIEQFANKNSISNNTVFETAFGIALQKYSGSDDIVFDKIISGRSIPLKNIRNTVGPFINTVPVRIRYNESSVFADLLEEIQSQNINATKYGLLPLSTVYKDCGIDNRAIDALFVFENYYIGDISEIESGPLSPKVISFKEQTDSFFDSSINIIMR